MVKKKVAESKEKEKPKQKEEEKPQQNRRISSLFGLHSEKIEAFRVDEPFGKLLLFLTQNLKIINYKMSSGSSSFMTLHNKSELYRFLIKYALENQRELKEFIQEDYYGKINKKQD